MTTVRRIDSVCAEGTDYSSTFHARTARDLDARTWALSVFGDAPAVFRLALRVGWRVILRLRLDGPAEALGWSLDTAVEGRAVLRADGPLLAAVNVVEVSSGSATWTTQVSYRGRLGRVLWGVAAPVHHLTLPWLLRRAARR